jgi:phosphoglycerol transferase MdoB-like AlkP superfamily enzyme/glycerophosphoryl diester phosphodiesterase
MITAAALLALAAKALGVGYAILPQPLETLGAPIVAMACLISVVGSLIVLAPVAARAPLALLCNTLGTLALLGDLWHARYYDSAWSFAQFGQFSQLLVVSSSLTALMQPGDVWLLSDVAVLTLWRWLHGASAQTHSARRLFVANLACATLAAALLMWMRPRLDQVIEFEYSFGDVAGTLGLGGYHALDAAVAVADMGRGRLATPEQDVAPLEAWLESRQSERQISPLAGAARGRNVILVSAESLPAFAIGMSVEGQAIAPHFTAFAAESLHYTDYYEQTHRGTTSDAEFMVLNSLLPLSRGAVATRFKGHTFRALPAVLSDAGYTTFSAAGEPPTFWNMRDIHRRYGVGRSMFLPDFRLTEWIGAGLADDVFLTQVGATLHGLRQPFFAFVLTSSNHHPWRIPPARRLLEPPPLDGALSGAYLQSIRFADEAFGGFIADLRGRGLLDRSLVIAYGDHRAGLDEESHRELWRASGRTSTPSAFELWRFERRVPLLIRLPQGEAAGPRDVPGGHVDLAPTIASLLGVDDTPTPWLGHDLTAPASRLVAFRDGDVTNGQVTLLSANAGTSCYARDTSSIPCDDMAVLADRGRQLFEISDALITGDLIGTVAERIGARPARAPDARRPRVLAIAHRGDSRNLPENTAPAITAAFDAGADIVEVDVRLSRDKVPIIFHDDTLERTSDGHGRPEALRLDQFKALDAGSWKGPQFRGIRPLSLAEALALSKGRGRLYLDVKNDNLAAPIASVLRRLDIDASQVLIGVWTLDAVAAFRQHLPGAPVVFATEAPVRWAPGLFDEFKRVGLWGLELGDYWPAAFIGDAIWSGLPVLAYTANDEPTIRGLVEKGVQGIESDDPALLVRVLERLRQE